MSRRKRSFQNICKNMTLVLLTALMAVLVALNWGTGLGRDNIPAGTLLSDLYALLPVGDGGYVQRSGETPAAYPCSIAMTVGGRLQGAAYHEMVEGTLYETVKPLWKEAMAAARNFEPADEAAFAEALRGKTLYLSYHTSLPLSLLAGWLGTEPARVDDRKVISLVLTGDGALYVRDSADGAVYRAGARARLEQGMWDKAAAGMTAPVCAYAGTLDPAFYGALLPETLVPEGAAAYDVLETRVPAFGDPASGDSLQSLLKAFSYEPYVQSYLENDGETQVFIENYSALRVSQDGTVRFKANSLTGGLAAYQEGESGPAALAAQIDYAHTLLNASLSAIGATVQAELQSAQYDREAGAWSLKFTQTVGGIPVRRTDGSAFAHFTYQDGVMIAAEIKLRDYVPTGEKLYVLPVRQAAAALTGAHTQQYILAYKDDGSGRLLAGAYHKDWRRGGAVG